MFLPSGDFFDEKVEMRKLLKAELVIFVLPAGCFIFLWDPSSHTPYLYDGFAVLFLKFLSSVTSVAYSNTTRMSRLKTLLYICWINIIFIWLTRGFIETQISVFAALISYTLTHKLVFVHG